MNSCYQMYDRLTTLNAKTLSRYRHMLTRLKFSLVGELVCRNRHVPTRWSQGVKLPPWALDNHAKPTRHGCNFTCCDAIWNNRYTGRRWCHHDICAQFRHRLFHLVRFIFVIVFWPTRPTRSARAIRLARPIRPCRMVGKRRTTRGHWLVVRRRRALLIARPIRVVIIQF